MSIFILGFAAMFILGGLLIFALKVVVAYSRCSGGAPLLDGIIFPPVLLGVGSNVLFRHFDVSASGVIVGIISLIVMVAVYALAWKLGSR